MENKGKDRMKDLRDRARNFFEDVDPSHDWHHVRRVEKMALRLAEMKDADKKVVRAGALLHDIGRRKEDRGEIEEHASWGAERSRDILGDLGFRQEFIDSVSHVIEAHRYSKKPEPETLEARVLSDADNLDALGAVGIARGFAYSGEHGRVMFSDTGDVETARDHFRSKILSLDERMFTEPARKIADERKKYVEEFLDRVESEMRAEDQADAS